MLAGLSALLAVIVTVLDAFFRASLAGNGAESAELIDQGTITQHQHFGQPTHIRAIAIQLNAGAHHLQVLLFKAGCRAGFAGNGTSATRLDA